MPLGTVKPVAACLQAGEANAHGPKALDWSADISARLAELQALGVDKLRRKAQETDPEKKVFGAAMSAKVRRERPRFSWETSCRVACCVPAVTKKATLSASACPSSCAAGRLFACAQGAHTAKHESAAPAMQY